MLQKEDVAMAYDVEAISGHESITIINENLYDSPLEVYRLCFPNDKKYKESLTQLYRDTFSAHLTKKEVLSIKQIEDVVTTSRRGIPKSEMDILIKTVIEGMFQVELEYETTMSWSIIAGLGEDERYDISTMRERLDFMQGDNAPDQRVKTDPSRLSDHCIFKNKLIVGRIA